MCAQSKNAASMEGVIIKQYSMESTAALMACEANHFKSSD